VLIFEDLNFLVQPILEGVVHGLSLAV
jgi:hypothetical protein